MTSKTTTKATRKNSLKKSQKKSHRINRQRRLQKQLQMLVLERHSRKCIICHHPEREAIEEEFLHWRAPWKLAEDYNIADYRTIYRHARAAGILLKRRENLHSALDAFVEAVDDVKFTPDSILRAMRAYSCIDRHGRWTEIPTQVHISTFHDVHPTQTPAPYAKNDSTAASDILDIVPQYSNRASRSDATACAASSAQAFGVTEEYDEPDDEPDNEPDDDNDPKNESEAGTLEETTACAASPAQALPRNAVRGQNPRDRSVSDRTACATSPVQPVSAVSLSSDDRGRTVTATACAGLPRPSRGSPAQRVPKMPLGNGRNVTAITCAAPPAQALPRDALRGQNPKDRSPSDRTDCAALPRPSRGSPTQNYACRATQVNRGQLQEETGRCATATACADSSAQAPPRNEVRGPNPKDRSPSDRTDCAGLPRPSRGSPAQQVPKMPLGNGRNVTATTCAAPPAQAVSGVRLNSNHRRPNVNATACAVSSAQAPPRNEVRDHNLKDRSPSDRTDCAASPAQPAAPQKPKPDADGLIWHKRPGYPNQEVSEPDAQGRICYKSIMTPVASQLPPPEADARRAAELIYRSAIKKYGNP